MKAAVAYLGRLVDTRAHTWLPWAAVILAVVAAMSLRVVTSAKQELREAQAADDANDLAAAVVHLRRAARWYAPLSPFHVRALDALERIGAAAETRSDPEMALMAFRAMRSAILSARSFYTPEPERLDRANQAIARLMAALPPPQMDASKSREQLRLEHLALLQATHAPNVFWTLVLLLGFATWVGGAFAFCAKALDASHRLLVPEAWRWGTVVLFGLGCFVLGLSLA